MTSKSNLLTKIAFTAMISLIGYKVYSNFDKNIKRILITGSNKGIGYGMAKYILQNTSNYDIILSGRNYKKVNDAMSSLINLSSSYKNRISILIMDVSNKEEIERGSIELKTRFGSNLNLYCIVNNAAIFPEMNTKTKTLDIATKTIETNFFGSLYVTKYFGPLLDDKFKELRIVNMSSGGAATNVSKMSEEKKQILLNKNIDLKQLTELINDFLDCYDKNDDKKGFRLHSYGFSKACINTFTCFIANKMDIFKDKKNILINSCTPGLVNTDMIRNYQSNKKKSIEQGIRIPIMLILGNIHGKTGKFFGGNKIEEYCLDQYISVKQRNQSK